MGDYAGISIAFAVSTVLDVARPDGRPSEFLLTERSLDVPFVKDYDANGGSPLQWARRFDMANWGLFAARIDGRRVGGAAVAFDTPGLILLEGRKDLAVLWDLRVSAEARRQGVGSALFRAGEEWARAQGCRELKVETQDVNAAACRFYARQGCVLGAVRRFAYSEFPDEIQLLWYKGLADDARPARRD